MDKGSIYLYGRWTTIDLRRAGWVAGWGSGNTATLIIVPKLVRLAVRAASGHGWDDRGEKSKWDKNARNESHVETKGVGKRANSALRGERANKASRGPLSLSLYTVKHREETAPDGRQGRFGSEQSHGLDPKGV
jgi:hypothetical protein